MPKGERTDSIQSNGNSIHLDIYGTDRTKPAVIFIPGMGCHAGIYGEFLRGLAQKGMNAIGVDLPCHGKSSGPRGAFTFDEIMECISDVVSYGICRYNDSIGLMGTSMGGTYALYAAMRDERLKAVLCHNAMDIARDLSVATRFPGIVRFLIRRCRFVAAVAPRFPVPLRVLLCWNDVVESGELLRSLKNNAHMVWYYSLGTFGSFLDYRPGMGFRDIAVPLKVIVGDRDRLFPPEYCKSLAERIGPKGASFEILEGGHALTMERIPRTVEAAYAWFHENLNRRERK